MNFNLYTVYQPIFNLNTLEIIGYETLLRGPIPSDEIINRAVMLNRIKDLDFRIIENAIRNAALLTEKLFVNCHPISFQSISECINQNMLRKYSLDTGQIVIEVTEHQPLDSSEIALMKRYLHGLGIQIAIDDFGKTTSDIRILKEIEPDYLKLDKSITQTFNYHQELIRLVYNLGKEWGMEIIAEGIEEEKHVNQLKKMDITLGQGFWLGRPSIKDFSLIIQSRGKQKTP